MKMPKRLASFVPLLIVLAAGGILALSRQQPVTPPASDTTTQVPGAAGVVGSAVAPGPAAPPHQGALWIVDGAYTSDGQVPRLLAIDAQTGARLAELSPPYRDTVTSSDRRWQYVAELVRLGGEWHLIISLIDLERGAITRRFPLGPPTASPAEAAPNLMIGLLLAPDARRLAVTVTDSGAEQALTDVYVVDTDSGHSSHIWGFAEASKGEPPSVGSIMSGDGRSLFVVQNRQRHSAATEPARWSTRVAAIDLDTAALERVVDVPGEIAADGLWTNGALAPDGQMFYLVQDIVRGSELDGYRFVALDTRMFAVAHTQQVERGAGGEEFCQPEPMRFTPDGRYLYGYCNREPRRPRGYFQFLKVASGLVEQKVPLESTGEPTQMGDGLVWQMAPSPDNTLLYAANAKTKAIAVLDLRRRAIVRSTVLVDPAAEAPGASSWLARLFLSTASAKMIPQPGIVLSADGQRLYFVDVVDFEKGDGVWGVETGSFKLLGHWLSGKGISGLQLSADGSELYAISPDEHALYVLDALSGEVRRTFDQVLKQPYGFALGQ